MDRLERNQTSRLPPGQSVQWVIALLLAVIAAALWIRPTDSVVRTADAQQQPLAGARGIFAFTGPLDRDQYGLFMLDVDQGTVWCYGFDHVGGTRKLRLIAARTWIYDRYLRDFNCAAPDFREIQALVKQQREQSTWPADATSETASDSPTEKE